MKDLFDLEKIKVEKIGDVDFVVQVREEDLNQFFKKKTKKLGLENGKVVLKKGRLHLEGVTKVLGLKTAFKVEGKFVSKKNKVYFVPTVAIINGSRVTRRFLKKLASLINPVVDFSKYQIPVDRVTNIQINKGVLIVEGK